MDKIIVALLANPAVQRLMLAMAVKIGEQVATKLTALLPLIVAAAVDALVKRVPVIGDAELPTVEELVTDVRETVNQIPDIDIPVLSDLFDLTEFLKGK